VGSVFGLTNAHHGYLFANACANRIKLLVHDRFGIWCATRRLHQGSFFWPRQAPERDQAQMLTTKQFQALVVSLSLERMKTFKVSASKYNSANALAKYKRGSPNGRRRRGPANCRMLDFLKRLFGSKQVVGPVWIGTKPYLTNCVQVMPRSCRNVAGRACTKNCLHVR
jgi:transposase